MNTPTQFEKLGNFAPERSIGALFGRGLIIDLGPLLARVRLSNRLVAQQFVSLYQAFPGSTTEGFAHLDVKVGRRKWPAGLFKPQARFISEGREPFVPLPEAHALPLIEWGLNWTIATQAPNFLVIHAAVVALNDRAIILPGNPGAGKSTLCAALVAHGWRLLSDEFALIHPDTLQIHPIPRPISLKNASIDIIRARWPNAWYSPPVLDTSKGTVSLFRPPEDSVQSMKATASASCVVFPRYAADTSLSIERIPRARALARLAEHVVNFTELPRKHFGVLDRLFLTCQASDLAYSDLDDAIHLLGTIVLQDKPQNA